MTNEVFSKTDAKFKAACDKADIPNTARQASKWRAEKGLAWKTRLASRNK